MLDLGALAVGTDGILDLQFSLNLYVSGPSDGFQFDFLAANASPVPLPGTFWLMATALGVFGARQRLRRR